MHDRGRTIGADRHSREVDWPEALADLCEFRRIPRVPRVIEAPRRSGHHPPGPEATVVIPERAPGEVLRRHARDTHSVERHRLPPIELDRLSSGAVDGVRVTCVPAQHFSGRSLRDHNRRLWAGWVVAGPTRRFYHTGDTGYSPAFAELGERFGPFDLAAVPIGAYRPADMMHLVHTTPEEALRIGLDVRARRIVAMHFGTFDLADEPLDEPARRFRREAERRGLGLDQAWILKIGETREW